MGCAKNFVTFHFLSALFVKALNCKWSYHLVWDAKNISRKFIYPPAYCAFSTTYQTAVFNIRKKQSLVWRNRKSIRPPSLSFFLTQIYIGTKRKFRVQHALIATTWLPNHLTKLDERDLNWKLDTWRWSWYRSQFNQWLHLAVVGLWKRAFLGSWFDNSTDTLCLFPEYCTSFEYFLHVNIFVNFDFHLLWSGQP